VAPGASLKVASKGRKTSLAPAGIRTMADKPIACCFAGSAVPALIYLHMVIVL
jgi:hypothetical protein